MDGRRRRPGSESRDESKSMELRVCSALSRSLSRSLERARPLALALALSRSLALSLSCVYAHARVCVHEFVRVRSACVRQCGAESR